MVEGLKPNIEYKQQEEFRVSQVIVQWPNVAFVEVIKRINSSK